MCQLRPLLIALLLIASSARIQAEEAPTAAAPAPAAVPVEYGAVAWQRDWETARKAAREKGLPLAVVFQEVPG